MISAVILAKNEENNIIDCLEGLKFVDEVIVIDDESSDRTVERAKSKGAKVVKHSLERNFAKQRNFALTLAKNDWVLYVDADERVSPELAQEILKRVQDDKRDGYFIPREDKLFGKKIKHGELQRKKYIRLGKKDKGKWVGAVHEEWKISGKVETLKNPIIHLPHQSLSEFISEINFYTTIRAKELFDQGARSSWYSIILYTKGKFLYTYFYKLGFLDGLSGFVLSLIMSLHSFLVRGKLYLLSKK